MNTTKAISTKAISRRKALGRMVIASQMPSIIRGQNLNSELRLGLVGVGLRGCGATLQALTASDKVRLVAVGDLFADKIDGTGPRAAGLPAAGLPNLQASSEKALSRKAIDVPMSRQFSGFDAYKSVIDSCDAVILATPEGFMPAHFEYAAQQGKHIFLESPGGGSDVPELQRIRRANSIALEKGLSCLVGFNRRRQDVYIEAFKRVREEGLIGTIESGTVRWLGSSRRGVIERESSWSEMEYQLRNWAYFPWLCIEACMHTVTHGLDVCLRLLGSTPLAATAEGGKIVSDKDNLYGPALDYLYTDFEFPGGITIRSEGRQVTSMFKEVKETIIGERGILELGEGIITTLGGETLWQYRSPRSGDPNPYQVQMDLWIEHIFDGTGFNDVDTAVDACLSGVLARTAAYHQRRVTWDEMLKMNERFVPETLSWDNPPTIPDSRGIYPIPVPPIG